MNLSRRMFVGTGTAAVAGLFLSGCRTAGLVGREGDSKVGFVSEDQAVVKLADDIFNQCVLGKIKPPEGTLKQRWLQAGTGGAFYGQWIWDTMFITDLLALLPSNRDLIRKVFQNYWDFQARWNEKRPDFMHDMLPCMIEPQNQNWLNFPAYSQIPIIAWGMERVYRRNGDRTLLEQGIGPLERFHDWYWRERDVTDVGLIAVGAYSGDVQHARWETFDFECNLDGLKLTPHPKRKNGESGSWYGDILAAGNTAYLVMAEKSLARMAKAVGDRKMAARRMARVEKAIDAMREHMWDEKSGVFLSVNRDTMEKVPVATIGSWIPLMAGVPTRKMAARMAEAFKTENWQTPVPLPTVDRKDSRWVPDSYWRGDVWPAPNYQVATGLAEYGYKDLAAELADKTIANAIVNGVSEHYHAVTGKPLGVAYLGMTCTLVTMMLDGLSTKHHLELKFS